MIETAYLTPAIFAIKKYFCAMAFHPFPAIVKEMGRTALKAAKSLKKHEKQKREDKKV